MYDADLTLPSSYPRAPPVKRNPSEFDIIASDNTEPPVLFLHSPCKSEQLSPDLLSPF